ncbi:hypothetical protein TWF696_003106 [Orbilia brochopaga]
MEQLNILDQVEAEVQLLHEEIKFPLQSVQNGVYNIQNQNISLESSLEKMMALQLHNMEQARYQHDEIRYTLKTNQEESVNHFNNIEEALSLSQDKISVLEEKSDEIADLLYQARDDAKKNGGMAMHSLALLEKLGSIVDAGQPDDGNISLSIDERAKRARRNDRLSAAIRRIGKLAQGCKDTTYIEDDDAEEYQTSIQDILEVLQESQDGGVSLKRELAQLARRVLGVDSMYVEQSPAAWLNNKLAKEGNVVAKHLYGFNPDTVESKGFRKEQKLEGDLGAMVLSCRNEKRTAMSDSTGLIKVQSTRLYFRQEPSVEEGETKPAQAWKIEDISGTQRAPGLATPLIIRMYNVRSFERHDANSPWRMAMNGDLSRLQAAFASRMVNIYDVDEEGRTLLHAVVETIRHRNRPEEHAKRLQVCKFLLHQGADTNTLNNQGKSPINYLRSTVYDSQPSFVRLDVAQEAFDEILGSIFTNYSSPYDGEEALVVAVRGLMGGSSLFFDRLLGRLKSTGELDLNSYDASDNAVMLEFATATTDDIDVLLDNFEIAIKHGGDIHARTRDTKESCLHLIVRQIKENFTGTESMTSQQQWNFFLQRWLKLHVPRMKKMLEFGADIFATDAQPLIFSDGRNICYSVTRTMYRWAIQDHWWEAVEAAGYTRTGILEKEASDLGVTRREYETYLEDLAKETIDSLRQRFRIVELQ